ncbi:hypothetical protein ALHIDCOG_00197 [Klebsiella phage CPRSB]|nr:hypothetical protein ALHIDCOG_00197 [Klebsiella phage CPRSB]
MGASIYIYTLMRQMRKRVFLRYDAPGWALTELCQYSTMRSEIQRVIDNTPIKR